jgi:hypothetical protein
VDLLREDILLSCSSREGALTANSQDASPLERCHLSNLADLCQAQQYISTQSPDVREGFM